MNVLCYLSYTLLARTLRPIPDLCSRRYMDSHEDGKCRAMGAHGPVQLFHLHFVATSLQCSHAFTLMRNVTSSPTPCSRLSQSLELSSDSPAHSISSRVSNSLFPHSYFFALQSKPDKPATYPRGTITRSSSKSGLSFPCLAVRLRCGLERRASVFGRRVSQALAISKRTFIVHTSQPPRLRSGMCDS